MITHKSNQLPLLEQNPDVKTNTSGISSCVRNLILPGIVKKDTFLFIQSHSVILLLFAGNHSIRIVFMTLKR